MATYFPYIYLRFTINDIELGISRQDISVSLIIKNDKMEEKPSLI